MRYGLFIVARLAIAVFCVLTAGYAVLNASPFAFDMFVKPQLFPWLTTFVAWHHLWAAAAYGVSIATIVPELSPYRLRSGAASVAHWLAMAYAACFGALTLAMCVSPFLPTLWNDARALPAAVVALTPLIWLATIDHLAVRAELLDLEGDSESTTSPLRLFVACAVSALIVWVVHTLRGLTSGAAAGGVLAWTLTSVWALLLTLAVFGLLFTILGLVSALAARTSCPRWVEYATLVALVAAGLCEYVRRAVLPTVSLDPGGATIVAAAAGTALAVSWAGVMVRRPAVRSRSLRVASDLLLTPSFGLLGTALTLMGVPAAAVLTLDTIERLDWNAIGQRTVVLLESACVFGLALRATRPVIGERSAPAWLAWTPLPVLVTLVAMPAAANRTAAWSGDRAFAAETAFEGHAAGDIAFRTFGGLLLPRSGFDDAGYQQFLQRHAAAAGRVVVPEVDFSTAVVRAGGEARPDIFVFVIDSLRRDYLAPYNPAVTFTPNIDAFARENFAFRNAFTRHGGTELAMASIWSGAAAVRKVRVNEFARMNAIEKLVNGSGYRLAINDFTIAEHLRPDTPRVTIDPGVPSVETDLCRNLESLTVHLDESAADRRPVFGYLAPMNVHILNTRRGGPSSLDAEYPGFYAPYASRLRRLDACFGRFVSYLEARGRYDHSIIVLTSDHGDSLGEDGHWGHGTWLYPEDIRVPLIVRIPEALRPALTTDLARIAFSTDIAPTLYALAGRPVRDLGPLFGAPLFVPVGKALSDRRRESYLLTSSYGATFALLRRNGRFLYVSDLVDWRESAFDLSAAPLGTPVAVDSALRRVNQQRIREQVAELSALYEGSR